MYQSVVTSHTNPTLSGVAKFNRILADRMAVPCFGFSEAAGALVAGKPVLVSVKLIDIAEGDVGHVKAFLRACVDLDVKADLFFHTFDGTTLEYDVLEAGTRIFCANPEIRHTLEGFDKHLVDAWCPFLVDLGKRIEEAHFNIFSFGMAHKMQLGHYRRLNQKLKDFHLDYSVWISTAFHEKANFGDFHSISNELSQVFGSHIQFLGFLSDEAINYFLEKIQVFVAFFPKGVRSNNTSVYVPMEKGLPLLTNLDPFSPPWMKHGVNVLDINRLAQEDLTSARLAEIGARGRKDFHDHASWDSLLAVFRENQSRA